MNGGSIESGHSRARAWPALAYELLVFLSLAILVSLLAVLCELYHASRLQEKLHGQLNHRPEVAEPRQIQKGNTK
jgi:sensor c-di-GMP phosphodiesterase-like protein